MWDLKISSQSRQMRPPVCSVEGFSDLLPAVIPSVPSFVPSELEAKALHAAHRWAPSAFVSLGFFLIYFFPSTPKWFEIGRSVPTGNIPVFFFCCFSLFLLYPPGAKEEEKTKRCEGLQLKLSYFSVDAQRYS